MDICVYSDESGVFDRHHNDYFVFGGLVAFSYSEADEATRRYQHAEKLIKTKEGLANDDEAKACFLSNGGKSKLFRSLNNFHRNSARKPASSDAGGIAAVFILKNWYHTHYAKHRLQQKLRLSDSLPYGMVPPVQEIRSQGWCCAVSA